MTTMLRNLFTAALLALLAGGAHADIQLAREATMNLQLLLSEVVMLSYDESAEEYRTRTRDQIAVVDGQLPKLLADAAGRDAAVGAAMTEHWRVAKGSLLGGSKEFGQGLIKTGYDAKVHADVDNALQRLLAEIDRQYKLRDSSTPLAVRTHVLATRAIGSYIKAAGSPFGSYSDSFNTDEDSLDEYVLKVDAALAELRKANQKDAAANERLSRVNAKWQFIRVAILNASKQSTPFIVYKHGGDVTRELATFK